MDAINDGGAIALAAIGLAGLGLLVAIVLGVLGFTKRRVPLAPWVIVPSLVAGVGGLGALMGLDAQVYDNLTNAAGGQSAMFEGLKKLLSADFVGRWGAAVVYLASAWIAALVAVATAGKYKIGTWGAAVITILLSLASAMGLAAWALLAEGIGAQGLIIAAVVGVGGVGVGIGAIFRALDDDAVRIATLRFISGVSMILAVAYALKGLSVGGYIGIYHVAGTGTTEEVTKAITAQGATDTFALAALVLAMLIGFCGFFAELGDIVNRGMVVDILATVVVLVALGGFRFVENGAVKEAEYVAARGPLGAVFNDYGDRVPSTLVKSEAGISNVEYPRGFYGDIVRLDKVDGWVRTHKRVGKTWVEDCIEQKTEGFGCKHWRRLDGLKLHEGVTVVVGTMGDTAIEVLDVFDKVRAAGGTPKLLLNGGQGEIVPELIVDRSAMFGDITRGTDKEFYKGFWLDADKDRAFLGPVRWWEVEKDAKFPKEKLASYLENDRVKGISELNIMYSEHTKLRNAVKNCITLDAIGGDVPKCVLVRGESIDKAVELGRASMEPPTADDVGIEFKVEGPLPPEMILPPLRWEAEPIAQCVKDAQAVAPDDKKVEGVMLVNIIVGENQTIKTIEPAEKNKLESDDLLRCIQKRLKKVVSYPDPPEPPHNPWRDFTFESELRKGRAEEALTIVEMKLDIGA